MGQKITADELASALTLIAEIGSSEYALARPATRPVDVVLAHLPVIRGALDKGYTIRRIAAFVAAQIGHKMSEASLRSAVSRALKMNTSGAPKKVRPAQRTKSAMAQPVAQSMAVKTAAPVMSSAPALAQPVSPAVIAPVAASTQSVTQPAAGAAPALVASHAVTAAQQAMQPAPTGIHAIVTGLAQSTAHPAVQPVA